MFDKFKRKTPKMDMKKIPVEKIYVGTANVHPANQEIFDLTLDLSEIEEHIQFCSTTTDDKVIAQLTMLPYKTDKYKGERTHYLIFKNRY